MSNNSKLDALFIFPPLTLYERYGERKVGNVGECENVVRTWESVRM